MGGVNVSTIVAWSRRLLRGIFWARGECGLVQTLWTKLLRRVEELLNVCARVSQGCLMDGYLLRKVKVFGEKSIIFLSIKKQTLAGPTTLLA